MLEKMISCGWKISIKGVRFPFGRKLGKTQVTSLACVLLFSFLIIFPKGGIKIQGIPITWGYVLLGVFWGFSVFKEKFFLTTNRLLAFLLLLPFACLGAGSIGFLGTSEIGFAISYLVSFIFLPGVFLFSFSNSIDLLDFNFFKKLFLHSLFVVSAFGVFSFFYSFLTRDFLLIPYLMICPEDIQDFAITRMIDRGSFFKLVSTYNNGNIYGVCMLQMFPLFNFLERSIFKRFVYVIALVLTFSRTVWIGLFIAFLFYILFVVRKRVLFKLACLFLISFVFLFVCLSLIGFDFRFVFNSELGGRISQFETLKTFTILPSKPFESILEIVYLAILDNFGLLGLFLFLVAMIAPLALFFIRPSPFICLFGKRVKTCLAIGLVLYLILCCSDGAMQFIPTMVIFWFLASFLLSPRCICVENHCQALKRADSATRTENFCLKLKSDADLLV